MNNFKGKLYWAWNCPPGKNDIDINYLWGDNGYLYLQRNFLRKIIYKWRFYNSKDGWFEEERTITYPEPISENVLLYLNLYKVFKPANNYWGIKYKVSTTLIIISCKEEILDEEYRNEKFGCFHNGDANFNPESFPDCTSPDVDCF